MTTVWILLSSNYTETTIRGVYTTKALAEMALEQMREIGVYLDIEEHPLAGEKCPQRGCVGRYTAITCTECRCY